MDCPRNGSLQETRNRGKQAGSPIIRSRLPVSRPARLKPPGLDRWFGYLNRQYYANDLTPNVLRAASVVEGSEHYQRYMMAAWTPVLLPVREIGQDRLVDRRIDDSAFDAALTGRASADAGSVTLLQYGINEIRYGVVLRDSVLMVENEMYFPGWRGRLSTETASMDAIAVNAVFRGWRLSPGTYTMVASFEFPYRRVLTGIAASVTMLWLVLIELRFRGRAVQASDS